MVASQTQLLVGLSQSRLENGGYSIEMLQNELGLNSLLVGQHTAWVALLYLENVILAGV